MAKTFRPYAPEQIRLLPANLAEWLPAGHLARFVDETVNTLDLGGIEASYSEERGYPPYHPLMMTKVLVYGYAVGVRSSRKIERRLYEDVAFRYLGADNFPDPSLNEISSLCQDNSLDLAHPCAIWRARGYGVENGEKRSDNVTESILAERTGIEA